MVRTPISPAWLPRPLDTYILYQLQVASLLAFVLIIATLWIMYLMAFSMLALILVAVEAALFATVTMGVLVTLVVVW